MPGNNPVILPGKVPVGVPSVVFELVITGFEVVLQQIPLTVTGTPPFAIIFPPDVAAFSVIADTALGIGI